MLAHRKFRFIEPQGRPERPLNAWITRWPLLGPITLASILEQHRCDVLIHNENISGALEDNPRAWRDLADAHVVGISIMTASANRGYQLADLIKRRLPHVTVVIGGVHATFCPDEAARHADIVVCGEAENVIVPIAAGEITHGVVRPEPPQDLDIIPTLNHFLVRDFEQLIRAARRRDLYELPVMASRGCPHGCTYCTVTQMFGRRVRRQSPAKVQRDFQAYAQRGFRYLFVYDDNFTADRDWTIDVCRRIAPLKLRFNIQVRVDLHWRDAARTRRDDELLTALQQSGCTGLYIGYETIDAETARHWHKGYRGAAELPQRLREDTRILHDHGFWIHGMFVMGPTHDRRTAAEIVRFARACCLQTLQITVLTPYPGTQMYREMQEHLLLDDYPADWDYYDACHVTYSHGRLPAPVFQQVVLDAHRRFYRFGGWNPLTLKLLHRQPIGLHDKLNQIRDAWRDLRTIMPLWRRDNQRFAALLAARRRSTPPCPSLSSPADAIVAVDEPAAAAD